MKCKNCKANQGYDSDCDLMCALETHRQPCKLSESTIEKRLNDLAKSWQDYLKSLDEN